MAAELRDLIYFDHDKAASLFSQADNGLLKEIQEKIEDVNSRNATGSVDLKLVKGGGGSDFRSTQSVLESRALHHDLLVRLEKWLSDQGQLLDMNTFAGQPPLDFSNESIRKALSKPSLLTAEGWSEFQDFNRLLSSADKFNELGAFFSRNTVEQVKKTQAYQELNTQIEIARQAIKDERNRDTKAKKTLLLKELEKALEEKLEVKSEIIPDWLLKGMKLLIGTFMPNRLQIQLYPFEKNPEFSIIANLKRDCFLDADFENVLFAYGVRPNAILTIFGLTTSVPPDGPPLFDVTASRQSSPGKQQGFQDGIQQMFNSFAELESLVRPANYPSVTVYPIAVYQRLGDLVPDEEGEALPEQKAE